MKRLFALFFAFVMIFTLVACGRPVKPSDTTDTTVSTDTTISDTTETIDPDADSIINIPLFDQDGIKIALKGYFPGDDFGITGPQLKLLVENDTDKNIMIQVRDVSVNGFMTDPVCSIEVAAQKKAYDTITWLVSDLEQSEITQFNTVEFKFHIFDATLWEDIMTSEIIVIKLN